MCLIIERKPNFEIPFDKFKAAITVNPDGYGLTFPDSGKLQVLKSHETPDPEKLYRLINEELIDKKLLIHLRYTTVGKTNIRNAHPFPVLERATDGVDLRMAHNGTLYKYKKQNSDESDTRVFVKEFVRPLFKRMAKAMDPSQLLTDEFIKELLEDKLTSSSVLSFLDSEGNSLICNATGNGGKQEDDWYYSNTYSFKENHRVKPANTVTNYTEYWKANNPPPVTKKFKDTDTERFSKKYGMKSLRDTFALRDDTIASICEEPAEAELLIKELIAELYLKDKQK